MFTLYPRAVPAGAAVEFVLCAEGCTEKTVAVTLQSMEMYNVPHSTQY